MKLVDVDQKTQGTFFRCLHDEAPENPDVIALRRRWYEMHRDKGLRAKVLVRDDGAVVGLCQYLPIEHSHYVGSDLLAILCMWVHGYEHLVGKQQGKGYGRFMLEGIEEDARASGAKGVAACGAEFPPPWDSVAFYEHMGYSRVDKRGPEVLVWKRFCEDAQPPSMLHLKRRPEKGIDKPRLTVLHCGWCSIGCGWCVAAREAVKGIEEHVLYEEIDTTDRATKLDWGMEDGVLLDGEWYGGRPWGSEDLRKEILRRRGVLPTEGAEEEKES